MCQVYEVYEYSDIEHGYGYGRHVTFTTDRHWINKLPGQPWVLYGIQTVTPSEVQDRAEEWERMAKNARAVLKSRQKK